MTQIAPHEVGASEVDFLFSSVPKVVHPAMFQEPAHNTGYLDIVAKPVQERPQTTNSSYQQINFYARLRSPI